jgi:hypothetical protein
MDRCPRSESMKAVAIRAFGAPEGLQVVSCVTPTTGPGKVLIATEAIGVGGVDVLIRSGALAAYGFKDGHVLGSEVVGTITEVTSSRGQRWRRSSARSRISCQDNGFRVFTWWTPAVEPHLCRPVTMDSSSAFSSAPRLACRVMSSDRRATRILAQSLVRDLLAVGFDTCDLIALAAELVDEVAEAKAARRSRGQQRRGHDVNRKHDHCHDGVADDHVALASGNALRAASDVR